MKVSDSAWHQQLSERQGDSASDRSPYWLGPFQNYQTFCPYLDRYTARCENSVLVSSHCPEPYSGPAARSAAKPTTPQPAKGSGYQGRSPWLVGTYEDVAELVGGYIRSGYRSVILDIPANGDELEHVRKVFDLALRAVSPSTV